MSTDGADDQQVVVRRLGAPRTGEVSNAATVIPIAMTIAIAASVLAAIIGLRMAFHATVIRCPNGTGFPNGTTDFRCYAHEHAGQGTAILLFAIVFVVLVSLVGYLALLQIPTLESRD